MRRRPCPLSVMFLAALVLLSWRCKDENGPANGDSLSNIVFPPDSVSYTYHLQPLFNQACTFAGCHDEGSHQSALKLTSYVNLMYNSNLVVVRNQPNQSILVFRIEGQILPRMPLNLPSLNQNQINGIRTWIAEGANNN